MKKHIALLHLYNEAKDATQVRVESFILFYRLGRADSFFLNLDADIDRQSMSSNFFTPS